jgi:hypothetical protein
MGMGRKKNISHCSADVENVNRRFAYSETCQAILTMCHELKITNFHRKFSNVTNSTTSEKRYGMKALIFLKVSKQRR